MLDSNRKFEQYLQKALSRLVEDENQQDHSDFTTENKKIVKFSTCFNELANVLGLNEDRE